jgi:hypothetical protein
VVSSVQKKKKATVAMGPGNKEKGYTLHAWRTAI